MVLSLAAYAGVLITYSGGWVYSGPGQSPRRLQSPYCPLNLRVNNPWAT